MPNPTEAKRIIEAALLSSQEPLSLTDLKRLFASFAAMEREHMDTLCRRYHLEVDGRAANVGRQ